MMKLQQLHLFTRQKKWCGNVGVSHVRGVCVSPFSSNSHCDRTITANDFQLKRRSWTLDSIIFAGRNSLTRRCNSNNSYNNIYFTKLGSNVIQSNSLIPSFASSFNYFSTSREEGETDQPPTPSNISTPLKGKLERNAPPTATPLKDKSPSSLKDNINTSATILKGKPNESLEEAKEEIPTSQILKTLGKFLWPKEMKVRARVLVALALLVFSKVHPSSFLFPFLLHHLQ